MAYEGPEYWTVIYRAIGDFGSLMRDAAQAKAALQGMQDAVKAESAAEVAGSTQAAAARQKDIQAIQQETQALSQLANTAKNTNSQLLYGGRTSPEQHLSDMAQELNYTTLLNRQKWMGFSSVQQAMAYRQQMYNLALLENRAHFAGYQTADQFLAFMQKEISETSALSAAIRERAAVIAGETSALLAHSNALQGTHQTAGGLGQQLTTASAFAAAISGIPSLVTTHLRVDDTAAMAELATYRAALLGLPHAERTDIISSATRLGGIPFTGGRVPVTPELSGGSGQALAGELARLSSEVVRPRVELEGGPQAVTEASLLARELEELDRRSRLNIGVGFGDVEHARLEADKLQDDLKVLQGEVIESHLELEGGPQALKEEADLAAGLHALDGEEAHSYVYLDDEDGVQALSDYLTGLERIPARRDTVINVNAAGAIESIQEIGGGLDEDDDRLGSFVGDLVKASQERYEFRTGLDDEDTLKDLDQLDSKIESMQDQGKALLLGMGGASGGGGGGSPPFGGFAPDPDDEDAWNALAAAERGAAAQAVATAARFLNLADNASGVTEAAKYMTAAVRAQTLAVAASAAGVPGDAAAWENLAAAERDIGGQALASVAWFQEQAGAAGHAAQAAKLMTVATAAQTVAAKADAAAEMQDALARRSALPNPQDNAAWLALAAAEGEAGDAGDDFGNVLQGKVVPTLADAARNVRDLADASGSAYQKMLALNAVSRLLSLSQEDLNNSDDDILRGLVNLATEADNLAAAYGAANAAARRFAAGGAAGGAGGGSGGDGGGAGGGIAGGSPDPDDAAAWEAISRAIRDTDTAAKSASRSLGDVKTGLDGTKDPAAKAAAALKNTADQGAYLGWVMGLLQREVPLWSGLFGSTALIGQVKLWHVVLDSVIEVLALWIPALVTAGVGLAGFAAAAEKSAKEIYQQWQTLTTASQALGTTIAPLADNFKLLQNAVRPQVYQLLGDYLDVAGGKSNAFSQLILKTGNYLDQLGAKVVMFMETPGNGLSNFFQAGEKDLELIGQGFLSLGVIVAKFIEATQITHVAEDLATVGDFILKIAADIVQIVPTPILAAVLALHGFILWGGLAADAVGKVVIGISSLAGKLPALNDGAAAVARALGATNAQLINIGKSSAAVGAVTDVLGNSTTREEVSKLGVAIENTGQSIEEFVTSAGTTSASRLARFSEGLDEAGTKSVALGIAAGASDAQLATLAGRLGGVGEEAESAAVKGGGLMSWLGSISPLLGNVYVDIGLVVAALVGLGVYLGTRADDTRKFTTALGDAVQKASLFTVISTNVSNLAEVTTALNNAQKTGQGNATELAASQADLSGKLGEELTHVGAVSKAYGTDFVGALSLMNAAGVTTSQLFSSQAKVWDQAMQQVRGLIDGYKAMGQQMGAIGSDLDALNLQNSQQVASMGKLNDAYDAFTKTVGGAPSAFITMAQGFSTFQKDAAAAGASMTGLSAPSLQLQSDFQNNYSNVEQFFDAFRNDQALTGKGNFTQFVKDAVASLIPMAGNSKEAAAQISALAQEAGGPATDNIKTLQKWVGGIKDPLEAMYKASNDAAAGASNLSQDAQRLTNSLQGLLNPAMAQAIFNAKGGQKVFADWETALGKYGPNSKQAADATKQVATELEAIEGKGGEAKSTFEAFAKSSGLSSSQADKLWAQASTHITANLGEVRKGLAQTATATAQLGTPGLWGQIEHQYMAKFDQMVTWFGSTMPHALEAAWKGVSDWFTQSVPHAFDSIPRAFKSAWNGTIDWFTQSIPHAFDLSAFKSAWSGTVDWFTQSVPHAFETAWAATWRDAVAPVSKALGGVTSWVAGNFDPWWATHGDSVKKVWNAAWQSMSAPALKMFHSVETGAVNFWHFLDSIHVSVPWGSIWKGIATAASATWKGITVAASAAWKGIETAASATWHFIENLFNSGFAKDIWKGFGEAGKQAWQWIKVAASDGLATVEQVFTGMGHAAQATWDVILATFKILWAQAGLVVKSVWDVAVGVVSVALDAITGHWHQAWADMQTAAEQVWNNVRDAGQATWAAIESLGKQLWSTIFAPVLGFFNAQVAQPLEKFFTSTLPGWFAAYASSWSSHWIDGWHAFDGNIIQPMAKFFTSTVPGWANAASGFFRNAWIDTWNGFVKYLADPVLNFFTATLPDRVKSVGSFFANAWVGVWNDFVRYIADPILNFFTGTLPNAITGAISGAISRVSGAISSVIHIIPGLASGGGVPMASGSVPGTGDEDGTHIIAMGGEFMIRKPARMALQAEFGPDFLTRLNHADVWLGSGSRGNAASQKNSGGGRYAAGSVIGAVRGATANPDQQEAMALGAYLLTRMNAAGADPSRGEYGAWLVNLARHNGVTQAMAQNAVQEARLVAPAYAAAVRGQPPDRWKSDPQTAALHAYGAASTALGTRWTVPSKGMLATAWDFVQADLRPGRPGEVNPGFAAGGLTAGAPAPQLSSVASMFGGGMAAGGIVPGLTLPGMSAGLTKQLTAATSGQLPRTLSEAGGNRTGLHVDQLTINNPKAEQPSESITRASNRLAFLGGRGMI